MLIIPLRLCAFASLRELFPPKFENQNKTLFLALIFSTTEYFLTILAKHWMITQQNLILFHGK